MNNVIFAGQDYKLTPETFEYKGYTENLSNIADIYVSEAGPKQKAWAGFGLSVVVFALALMLGLALEFLLNETYVFPIGAFLIVSAIGGFIVGYLREAKYRLFIMKTSGNKGKIDQDKVSREFFDSLTQKVKGAMKQLYNSK